MKPETTGLYKERMKAMLSSLEIAKIAVKALDGKQAKDIQILKTDKVTVLADYFIICGSGGKRLHL